MAPRASPVCICPLVVSVLAWWVHSGPGLRREAVGLGGPLSGTGTLPISHPGFLSELRSYTQWPLSLGLRLWCVNPVGWHRRGPCPPSCAPGLGSSGCESLLCHSSHKPMPQLLPITCVLPLGMEGLWLGPPPWPQQDRSSALPVPSSSQSPLQSQSCCRERGLPRGPWAQHTLPAHVFS